MNRLFISILLLGITCSVAAQTDDNTEKERKPKKEDAKKALKELQKQYDLLQKQHRQLQGEYEALRQQDSIRQADMLANEEARRQQGAYFELCRQNLYHEYMTYLDMPFSVVSLDKIADINTFAAGYADTDTDAPALQARAEACLRHKLQFDHMTALLTQPFDASVIQAARDSLLVLRKLAKKDKWDELAMSRTQWAETDTIDVFFSRYKPGVKWLQDVMKRCSDQYARDGLNATNRTDVVLSVDTRQKIISEEDTRQMSYVSRRISPQGNVADYILLIPWLRQRYETFVSEPNPLKPSEATRRAIREIQEISTGL